MRELAGLFNQNDQFDFKFNVNGKEVSGEEGSKYAQELIDKMTSEMGGLVKKLSKGAASNIASAKLDELKDKIPSNLNVESIKEKIPSSLNVENILDKIPSNLILDSIKEKVMPHLNIDSVKDLVNQETFSKLQEKLPVIDASNDDGNIKLNVNGKPLFSLNLSDFIKK